MKHCVYNICISVCAFINDSLTRCCLGCVQRCQFVTHSKANCVILSYSECFHLGRTEVSFCFVGFCVIQMLTFSVVSVSDKLVLHRFADR